MMLIPLTQGQFAMVDDCDYERLWHFSWQAKWEKGNSSFYAARAKWVILPSGKWKRVTCQMHREVMFLRYGDKRNVDHKNRNSLDNQRHNLRIATEAENSQNRTKNSRNTSGYKGVTWNRSANRWQVMIGVNGDRLYVGVFTDVQQAALAYNKAAKVHHGEFATLNEVGPR